MGEGGLTVTCGVCPQETLVLKLHKPKSSKKVQWDEAVVDNEHLGKKKSKCEFNMPPEEPGPATALKCSSPNFCRLLYLYQAPEV